MRVLNKNTGQIIEIADAPTPSKNSPTFYWNVRDILFYPSKHNNVRELKSPKELKI